MLFPAGRVEDWEIRGGGNTDRALKNGFGIIP